MCKATIGLICTARVRHSHVDCIPIDAGLRHSEVTNPYLLCVACSAKIPPTKWIYNVRTVGAEAIEGRQAIPGQLYDPTIREYTSEAHADAEMHVAR